MPQNVINVDALMDILVKADTHDKALRLAMMFTPAALVDLLDLLHVDTPEMTPRKITQALRVVIVGRGLDEQEANDLCASVGRCSLPVLVG